MLIWSVRCLAWVRGPNSHSGMLHPMSRLRMDSRWSLRVGIDGAFGAGQRRQLGGRRAVDQAPQLPAPWEVRCLFSAVLGLGLHRDTLC